MKVCIFLMFSKHLWLGFCWTSDTFPFEGYTTSNIHIHTIYMFMGLTLSDWSQELNFFVGYPPSVL